jgi:osmoprotectant transport system substrate-binding protein
LSVLDPTEADDTNVVAVRSEVANRLGLRSLSDLARVSEPLRFGGPPDCPQRFECLGGLVQLYRVDVAVPAATGTTILTATTTTVPTTSTTTTRPNKKK